MLALAVVFYALGRVRSDQREDGLAAPGSPVIAVPAAVLGALLFAGSLDAGGSVPWPGYPAGIACAGLGLVAARGLLGRARRRLDASAAALLPAWADAASLALAAVAIAFPPASLVGLAALAYVLVALRRSDERKYGGLRILR